MMRKGAKIISIVMYELAVNVVATKFFRFRKVQCLFLTHEIAREETDRSPREEYTVLTLKCINKIESKLGNEVVQSFHDDIFYCRKVVRATDVNLLNEFC